MAAVAIATAAAALFAAGTADVSNIKMRAPSAVPAEAAATGPAPAPAAEDLNLARHRRRRMSYFDLANLLDQDGNLQNEMMVFAFAATMLSTIPILLGNEFDVNVGLRRRKREMVPQDHYGRYAAHDPSSVGDGFTEMTYVKLMQETANTTKHKHDTKKDPAVTEPSMGRVVQDLLVWSKQKLKDKTLIGSLVDLVIAKIQGYKDPSDKMVRKLYKLWYGL